MFKDIARQMIPFLILLLVLWVAAEVLERTLTTRRGAILAPPVRPQSGVQADGAPSEAPMRTLHIESIEPASPVNGE